MATRFESPFNATRKMLRKRLLQAIRAEKKRHWQMRGSHKRGEYFELGFFRGLNHADKIIRAGLSPASILGKEWQEMLRKQREAGIRLSDY
jgi:hypothetical protein